MRITHVRGMIMNITNPRRLPLVLAGACVVLIVCYLWTRDSVHHLDYPGTVPKNPDSLLLPNRSRDGTWYTMGRNREIYVYSAFFDDRVNLALSPVVRLIAVSESSVEEKGIFCHVWYPDETQVDVNKINPTPIGAGVPAHGKYFKEYVYVCPLSHYTNKVPKQVGISESPSENATQLIPIEVPEKPQTKDDVGSCVSVTYWHHEPYRIVEWMELHKIWGISRVTIYNNSLEEAPTKVFQHYAKQGYVDFRHSTNFIPDPGERIIHLHMSPVINDCILRNMHRFKKIVVTDLDEMIVPRQHDNYTEMISAIERSQGGSHPHPSYTFRNCYFFLNLEGDKTQPKQMATLHHRKRQPVSPPWYSVKSIVDPQACTNMHNHMCWRRASKLDYSGNNLDIDPELAMNQHYKNCHFDKYLGKPGECSRLFKEAVKDDTMLRFKSRLLDGVTRQLKLLGMQPLEV